MVRRISPRAPASHTADQPPALGQTLGQELAAAFESDDYALTPDDAAALVAQLATLGVRRLKVPPRAP